MKHGIYWCWDVQDFPGAVMMLLQKDAIQYLSGEGHILYYDHSQPFSGIYRLAEPPEPPDVAVPPPMVRVQLGDLVGWAIGAVHNIGSIRVMWDDFTISVECVTDLIVIENDANNIALEAELQEHIDENT